MEQQAGLIAGRPLAGTATRAVEVHADDRGSFAEYFVDGLDTGLDPRQWSVVRSEPGTLRGMHVHLGHDEYISPIIGHCYVGLYDLRPDSPTVGEWALYELSAREPIVLTFARGTVHGWLVDEPTVHLQATSSTYGDYGSHDNNGCHWADPELGIPWPFEPTLVAPRADGFGTLAELRARVLSDVRC